MADSHISPPEVSSAVHPAAESTTTTAPTTTTTTTASTAEAPQPVSVIPVEATSAETAPANDSASAEPVTVTAPTTAPVQQSENDNIEHEQHQHLDQEHKDESEHPVESKDATEPGSETPAQGDEQQSATDGAAAPADMHSHDAPAKEEHGPITEGRLGHKAPGFTKYVSIDTQSRTSHSRCASLLYLFSLHTPTDHLFVLLFITDNSGSQSVTSGLAMSLWTLRICMLICKTRSSTLLTPLRLGLPKPAKVFCSTQSALKTRLLLTV